MKLSLVPVFCTVGVEFVIDYRAQRWLRHVVGDLLEPGPEFTRRYGNDLRLVVYLDGDPTLGGARVLGPKLFKKAKDLEIRVVVPMPRPFVEADEEVCAIVRVILWVLIDEFGKLGIETRALGHMADSIVDRFSRKEWLDVRPVASVG